MGKVLLVLTIATMGTAKPQGGQPTQGGKIVGGEEAPEHEFPWQISLRSFGAHICSGSIINQHQVISAAHCMAPLMGPIIDTVIAGVHDRIGEGGHQKRRIASMEAHENHNEPEFDNDVAIITVTQPFDFSDPNVQPISMFMSDDAEIPAETICNATGWGALWGGGIHPNNLQWIQIPLLSHEDCVQLYPEYITDGIVCAGASNHTTCSGDSGGPLVCPDAQGKGKLAGLVSFGHKGCPDAGVFTKVSFYEDWIQARVDQ